MNARINFQIINGPDGSPAFAVVPYADFLARIQPRDDLIPHEVVRRNVIDEIPMVRAWREHLGHTQAEVAERAGITQAALAQMESGEHKTRKATLVKLAAAMGLSVGQLTA